MSFPHRTVALAVMLALAAGCATTKQGRGVQKSGFLNDYSLLVPGGEGRALLTYLNPNVNVANYDKILLDEVTVWQGPDSQLKEVPPEDLRRLALDLHEQLKRKLEEDYEMVDQPGPGVIRVRAALTEAGKSNAVLDIFSTVVPQARLLSAGKSMVTGTGAFVGGASAEIELTDAQTGELIAAAADNRVGGKTLEGSTDPWSDVHFAFAYWAERVRERLREERAASVQAGAAPQP